MLFDIDPDTLPTNTIAAIDAAINPLLSGPNHGLTPATVGQRYLLTEGTGSTNGYAEAWAGVGGQPLIAPANSVIEYNGTYWVVAFDPSNTTIQYVTNITTEIQYKWSEYEGVWAWTKSYQGLYPGGKWRIIL
jgi:hypothetical protein